MYLLFIFQYMIYPCLSKYFKLFIRSFLNVAIMQSFTYFIPFYHCLRLYLTDFVLMSLSPFWGKGGSSCGCVRGCAVGSAAFPIKLGVPHASCARNGVSMSPSMTSTSPQTSTMVGLSQRCPWPCYEGDETISKSKSKIHNLKYNLINKY